MKQHVVNSKFWLGDIVYRIVDRSHTPGMVTGIHVRPDHIAYTVGFEDGDQVMWEMEIDSEPNYTLGRQTEDDD